MDLPSPRWPRRSPGAGDTGHPQLGRTGHEAGPVGTWTETSCLADGPAFCRLRDRSRSARGSARASSRRSRRVASAFSSRPGAPRRARRRTRPDGPQRFDEQVPWRERSRAALGAARAEHEDRRRLRTSAKPRPTLSSRPRAVSRSSDGRDAGRSRRPRVRRSPARLKSRGGHPERPSAPSTMA